MRGASCHSKEGFRSSAINQHQNYITSFTATIQILSLIMSLPSSEYSTLPTREKLVNLGPLANALADAGEGSELKRKHDEDAAQNADEERKRTCPEPGGPSENPSRGKEKTGRQCLRIQNVPLEWSKTDLLDFLRMLVTGDESLDDLDASALSLYPACSGGRQTALLNPEEPLPYFQELRTTNSVYLPVNDKLSGRKIFDLEVDSDFPGLTPLNAPKGEIVVELVSYFYFPQGSGVSEETDLGNII